MLVHVLVKCSSFSWVMLETMLDFIWLRVRFGPRSLDDKHKLRPHKGEETIFFFQFSCFLQESLQNGYEKKIYKIKQDWKEQVLIVTCDQYVPDWRMPPCNPPASYSDPSPTLRKGRRDGISAERCFAFYSFPWCLGPCMFPIIPLVALIFRNACGRG